MLKTQGHYKLVTMKIDPKFASLAALLVLLGFGAGYLLSTEPDVSFQNPDITLSVDPECKLNEAACERPIAEAGSMLFSIGPKPVLGASPLTFELTTNNIDVDRAAIDLKGVSMNMGSYRLLLEADGEGGFRTEGNLPVCVRNQMLWQADVWLQSPKLGLIKVPFQFTAYKR